MSGHGKKRQPGQRPVIYYDGDCPMCRSFASGASERSPELELRDVRSGELPPGADREAALREMYFVDAEGRTLRGAHAVIGTLRGRWWGELLYAVSTVPGFRQLIELGYKFVAMNRFRLFGRRSQ